MKRAELEHFVSLVQCADATSMAPWVRFEMGRLIGVLSALMDENEQLHETIVRTREPYVPPYTGPR